MLYEYVIVELIDNELHGLGVQAFKAPSHKGDFIIMDNTGVEREYPGGKAFEVIAVKLAPVNSADSLQSAGDLVVRSVGSEFNVNDQLREANKA